MLSESNLIYIVKWKDENTQITHANDVLQVIWILFGTHIKELRDVEGMFVIWLHLLFINSRNAITLRP